MPTYTLPYPTRVTTNSLYKYHAEPVLTEWAELWRDEALIEIRRQRIALPPSAWLMIECEAYMPDLRRRDLDNLLKLTVDVVTRELGIDDGRVIDLHIVKVFDRRSPRLVVKVTQCAIVDRKPGF